MKQQLIIFGAIILSLLLISCQSGPKPIDYGHDGCHYCKMTIVDKIHGAEIVTDKGKVYKFDATECMLHFTRDNPDLEVGHYFTNHYDIPEDLVLATDATFLISPELPSPMGEYITAFENEASAKAVQAKIGGTLYTWESLNVHMNK